MSEPASPLSTNIQDFFITGLRNAHAMETQALQIMRRQTERLENYPDLLAALHRHIAETEQQRQRLEDVLDRHGESHSTLKDAALGAVGNAMAMAHIPAADEVIKDNLANYAFEHFEIAAYKTLITVADALGDNTAKAAAETSLAEEERMAAWIGDHLTPTTLQYLALAAGGR